MLPLHNAAIFSFYFTGAEGRGRTDTRVAPQQFLRLSRLPIPPLRLGLERKTRFELATSSLARRHSTTELLPPAGPIITWCRRRDLNSHRLAPTTPSRWRVYHSTTSAKKHYKNKNGRSERIRTPDRWFWRPLLYQLSYTPIRIKFTILVPKNKVLNGISRV